MRKTYLLLIFISATFSLSCMNEGQKEKKQLQLFSTNPYTEYNEIPLQQTHYNPEAYNHVPLQANEPGWQVYHNIMNAPYHTRKQKTDDPTDLEPVYLPVTTHTEEIKPFLTKNILPEPDKDLIQKLYKEARTLAYNGKHSKRSEPDGEIIQLINNINEARNKGIDENILAKSSYKIASEEFFRTDFTDLCAIILFHLLKKYTTTVNLSKEPLPTIRHSINTIFNDISYGDKNPIIDRSNISIMIQHYPAFFCLTYNFHRALNNKSYDTIHNLLNCLHSDQRITFDKNIPNTTNFKNDFYNQVKFLLKNGETTDLYPIIHMVENTHNERYKKTPSNLTDDIANFHPTKNMFFALEHVFNDALDATKDVSKTFDYGDFINDEKYSANIHNRIILFCKLIEKYTYERGNKQTPITPSQHHVYNTIKEFNLTMPQTINSDLIDASIYAFTAFADFIENTKALAQASQEDVQKLFDQQYSSRK